MKGVVFTGNRKLELRDFPDPSPSEDDVVIEIKASGMCGSDLHVYRSDGDLVGKYIAGHAVTVIGQGRRFGVIMPMTGGEGIPSQHAEHCADYRRAFDERGTVATGEVSKIK